MKSKTKVVISLSALAVLTVLLGIMFFFFLGSTYRKAEYKEAFEGVKFIAHRGLSSKYYENSEEAFIGAAESDFFYGIETDVHFTSDGVPVCSHNDDTFENADITVTQSTYDQIKDIPLKKDGYGHVNSEICLYQRYLDICAEYGKVAVIELKQVSLSKEQIRQVVEMAKSACGDKFVIIGFSKNYIMQVKDMDPSVKTQHLVSDRQSHVNSLNEGHDVSDYFNNIRKTHVAEVHAKGRKLGIWTVNNIDEARRYAEYGVDYITTDHDFLAEL